VRSAATAAGRDELDHVESARPRAQASTADAHHRMVKRVEDSESQVSDPRRNVHTATLVTFRKGGLQLTATRLVWPGCLELRDQSVHRRRQLRTRLSLVPISKGDTPRGLRPDLLLEACAENYTRGGRAREPRADRVGAERVVERGPTLEVQSHPRSIGLSAL
jgi:hypothetical protein